MPMKFNEDFSAPFKFRDIGRWHVTPFVEGVARARPARASDPNSGEECVLHARKP